MIEAGLVSPLPPVNDSTVEVKFPQKGLLIQGRQVVGAWGPRRGGAV